MTTNKVSHQFFKYLKIPSILLINAIGKELLDLEILGVKENGKHNGLMMIKFGIKLVKKQNKN